MSTTGDLIANRYRLVTKLGSGAMGVVWEARDERLQRQVALKQLRPQLALDPDELQLANQRAMREARISARLHHPNAVTVFDVVEHEGQPCIILQFVPSMPLSTVLREGGPLQENEAVQVGAQVAAALAAAHQAGIVHRDIKPGNILIADDGTALVSDFGISRVLGDASLTMTGMVHGTPAFLAPEVARGEDASPASDVFSLGATLYSALEGHPPFGSDASAIAILHRAAEGVINPPRRSGTLAPLLLEMLSADPATRPSMANVSERLERLRRTRVVATEQPTLAAKTSVAAPAVGAGPEDEAPQPMPGRRRTATVALALVALLAVVAVAVGLLLREDPETDRAVVAQSASASEPGSPPATPQETEPSASPTSADPSTPAPSDTESETEPPKTQPPKTQAPESKSPKARPAPSKTAAGTPSKSELAQAIRDYYALMPDDTDAGWKLLTPTYRRTHGGSRSAYGQFWGAINRVTATEVKGTKPDRVRATITYYFENGQVSRESTTFRLVRDDGVLKIDDSSVG